MSNSTGLRQNFETALLVVDMQFMYARQLAPEDQLFLPPAIEAFVQQTYLSIPPIYIEVRDEDMWRDDVDARQYDSVIERKTHPAMEGYLSRVFKNTSSAFEHGVHSDLNRVLKTIGARKLLVAGGFTRRCVWETAVDAANCGYDVSILQDLCRDSVSLKESTNYPEVTEVLCNQHGIRLENSGMYGNVALCENAAPLMATLRY